MMKDNLGKQHPAPDSLWFSDVVAVPQAPVLVGGRHHALPHRGLRNVFNQRLYYIKRSACVSRRGCRNPPPLFSSNQYFAFAILKAGATTRHSYNLKRRPLKVPLKSLLPPIDEPRDREVGALESQ